LFRELLTLEEAKQLVRQHFRISPLGVEEVSLLEAPNRVLAENIVAKLDIPPFNRSTVDGYAVRAEDTFGAEENNPVKLKLLGVVNVGELPRLKVDLQIQSSV
jgi:molybdopterin biosynthesis enzyme